MARRNDLDWDLIETDYRVAQLSIRQIAEKYGTEPSTITRRAKKAGWQRDLSEAVRAATKTKVRKAVIAQAQQTTQHATQDVAQHAENYATECTQHVFSEVDLAANVNAAIILRQQSRISRLSNIFEKATSDIELVSSDQAALEEIVRLLEEQDDKSAEAIKRLSSVTSRLNNLKTATEIMGKLTDAERTVFSLGEESKGSPVDDGIKVTFVRPE